MIKRKKPLKAKKKIRKKSKSPLALAKDKAWKALRAVVIKRDGHVCIPCGKEAKGSNQHGGHFIPSSTCGMFLRYDLRDVHSSCYYCNINLGGNGGEFYRSLVARYGEEFVEQLFTDKKREVKWGVKELLALADFYESLLVLSQEELIAFTKNYKGFQPTDYYESKHDK